MPAPVWVPGAGVVVAAITLLALALRLTSLTLQPLWWDEGYSVYFAAQDFAGITLKTAADIHPPFYYYLLHVWTAVFGPGDAAARLLSVFIGVACVPALFAVTRRVGGSRTGLAAALLLAISPFQIYYSQEVRMYALATLLGLGSIYFAQRILLSTGSLSPGNGLANPNRSRLAHWLGYLACTTLAMHTLYFAALIPLFQTIFALLAAWRKTLSPRAVLLWLAGQAALTLLFAPWLVTAAPILIDYVRAKMVVEARTPLSFITYLADHLTTFSAGHAPAGWQWTSAATAGLLVLAAAGAVWSLRSQPTSGAWYLMWLGVPLLGGFAINLVYPFSPAGYQRFMLFAQPALLVLAAGCVNWLPRGLSRSTLARATLGSATLLLMVGSAGALASFYTTPRYPADDYRPIIGQISALGNPADAVICVFPWQVGYLYAYHPLPLPHVVEAPESRWTADPGALKSDLSALIAHYRVIWFPAHQKLGAILEEQVESSLAAAAYPAANDWFGDTRLYAYAASGVWVDRPAGQSFDGRLLLSGATVGATPLETGAGVLSVQLRWRLTGKLGSEYAVRLRLADSQGRTWAQRDSAPAAGTEPFDQWAPASEHTDRHALLIPAGTPPGRYSLRLSVYSITTLDALTIAGVDGTTLGPELALADVTVAPSAFRPQAAALRMGQDTAFSFGEVGLRGFTVAPGVYRPGTQVLVSLYWQAIGTPRAGYIAFLQMQDFAGKPWALVETPDLGSGYTLDRMSPGDTVRSQYELLLPATIPDGEYRLAVGLLDPATRQRLKTGTGDQAVLTAVTVKGRAHSNAVPVMQRTVQARFGDMAELLGYNLTTAPGGRSFTVTLAWRALKETSASYAVFVHIAGERGMVVGQHDAVPQAGDAPTTSWIPGEVITDAHAVPVKADAPPGEYVLEIGMYDPRTGIRLAVTGADAAPSDHLILGRIQIEP